MSHDTAAGPGTDAGTGTDERLAIKYESEEGRTRTLTYRELRCEVNRAANALREIGIGRGDVVGVFMPMNVEIVVAMLAPLRIAQRLAPAPRCATTTRPLAIAGADSFNCWTMNS